MWCFLLNLREYHDFRGRGEGRDGGRGKEAAAIGNGYGAEAPLVTLSNCVIRVPGDNGAVTGFNGIKAKKVEPDVTNAGELEKKGVTLVIGKLEEI